jgi:hypothetical protein
MDMTDERAEYLATGSGDPADRERLDAILGILREDTTWSEPPPEVSDRVITAISDLANERRAPRRSRTWAYVAAVVGTAALVALVLGLTDVIGAPDEQIVAMEGTEIEASAGGEAALRSTGSGWWIRLEVSGLTPADPGTYYEGWMWNDEGEGVSIGTFHLRGGEEPVILWSGVDPADYPAIWITREPEDGDPGVSDQVVMRGRIEG